MKNIYQYQNKKDLIDTIVTLYLNIPNSSEVEILLGNIYSKYDLPPHTIVKINEVLQKVGIEKYNKEGLDTYLTDKFSSFTGFSNDNSIKILEGVNSLLSGYLYRQDILNKTNHLKQLNQNNEEELKIEIENLNREIKHRIDLQNIKIREYQNQIDNEKLSTSEFINKTEIFLDIDLKKEKNKNDVNDFLNGNNEIIKAKRKFGKIMTKTSLSHNLTKFSFCFNY